MEVQYDVLLFGSSCLSTDEDFSSAVRIISEYRNPVVIVNAISGVTQQLTELCLSHDKGISMERISDLQKLHLDAMSKITKKRTRDPSVEEVRKLFQELIDLVTGTRAVEPTERRALILSYGEKLSSVIMKWYLLNNNLSAVSLLANEIIVSRDENPMDASVDEEWSRELIRPAISKASGIGNITVLTGFLCRTPSGRLATLGRNSGDYTAALVSSSFNGSVMTCWLDMSGSKPEVEDSQVEAGFVGKIASNEGAVNNQGETKGIQATAILLAKKHSIPIRIRDFRNPELPGVLIGESTEFQRGNGKVSC